MIYNDERTPEQFPYPYVNNNGNTARSLIDERLAAKNAVIAARKALLEMSPHGRNYQTAPAGAFEAARKRHDAQVDALTEIADALYREAEFLHGQQV